MPMTIRKPPGAYTLTPADAGVVMGPGGCVRDSAGA